MASSPVIIQVATPGPAGPAGPGGATGPAGYSPRYYVQPGVPTSGVGLAGDMYINSTNSDVWGPKIDNTTWPATPACNIRGIAGYSPLYIVAAGAPSGATGVVGDMYINSTTSDLYGPKSAGGWGPIVANLKGATGSTGAQGPPGVAYTPRGAWSAATTYLQGDEATDVSILYISLQSSNLNHVPASSPTWWQPVTTGGGMTDPTTTKGDLIVRGTAGPATRLGVGSNGQILIADSAQTLGVKWGADISQTPWTSDINAAGFTLANAAAIGIGNSLAVRVNAVAQVDLNVGGSSALIGRIAAGTTTSTVGNAVGAYAFANFAIPATEKRVAQIASFLDGAIDSGNLAFQTFVAGALVERMRITAAGQVGIGTSVPGTMLDIVGSPGVSAIVKSTSYAGQAGIQAYRFNGTVASPTAPLAGEWIGQFTAHGYQPTVGASGKRGGMLVFAAENWSSAANGTYLTLETTLTGATTAAERLRIDVTGFIGMGMAGGSPLYQLDVRSSGTAAGGTQNAVAEFVQVFGTLKGVILGFDPAGQIGTIGAQSSGPASQLAFHTFDGSAWGERMRLHASGRLAIGGAGGVYDTAPLTIKSVNTIIPNTADASSTAGLALIGATINTRLLLGVGDTSHGYASWIQATYDNGGGTNGVEPLALQPLGGDVGVGTIPVVRFHVLGAAASFVGLFESSGTAAGISVKSATRQFNLLTDGFNRLFIQDANAAAIRMIIDSTGKMSVGPGSPSYQLDVAGDCNITGAYRVNGTPITGGPTAFASGGHLADTIYLNNSGKARWVSIVVSFTANNNVFAYCDAAASPTTQICAASGVSGNIETLTFLVLPGYYYKLLGAANVSLTSWFEWT